MSFALLFSGQGAQHPRMLRWLQDGTIARATGDELGVADWRAALCDPVWAARNQNAQVVLTGIALQAWRELAPALSAPAAIAGYSVGELAAFAAAGIFEPQAAILLARTRAAVMDRCAAAMPGGLLAVTGLPMAQIDAYLRADQGESALAMAIRNAPFMVVLGGPEAAVQRAMTRLPALGARCTRLNVEVASHTHSMNDASIEFSTALSTQVLQAPRYPLFSCTADRIVSSDAALKALAAQISNTLLWDDCLESINARRVDCVLEIGPGAALASMWNQRFPNTPARSADEFENGRAIVAWIEKQRQR